MKKKELNVYLAGKISNRDWRQQIVDIRNNQNLSGDNYSVNKIKNVKIKYKDNIYITGPFFLSCDHSCYHGENCHGLGANKHYGCYGETTLTEKQVNDICMSQIRKSDVLFAYINDNTCYGTLYEIGYAIAYGLKVILLFESGKLMKDMWFITKNAHILELVDKSERDYSVKRYFDETINHII